MDERKRRGDRGEAAVAAALERRGYAIAARQYRCRWGEIDLIARSPEGVLCFVEVKTRSGPGAGGGDPRQAPPPAGRGLLVPGPDRSGLPLPVRRGGGVRPGGPPPD